MQVQDRRLRAIIAITGSDLDAGPELEDLTGMIHARVVTEPVTIRRLYDVARSFQADIIHIVGHGTERGGEAQIVLDEGETLGATQAIRAMQLCGADCLILNACSVSQMASRVVLGGGSVCVYGNVDIPDRSAWEFPLMFYRELARLASLGEWGNYQRAYTVAAESAHDGIYGFQASYAHNARIFAVAGGNPAPVQLERLAMDLQSGLAEANRSLASLPALIATLRDLVSSGAASPPVTWGRLAWIFALLIVVSSVLTALVLWGVSQWPILMQ